MRVKKSKNKNRKCPLCTSMAGYLSGGSIKRYYCFYCSIEFTFNREGVVQDVYEVKANGVAENIPNWEDYKLYE